MNGYYRGKIKVVGCDRLCFPVNPKTLEADNCGCYDPYPYDDDEPIEIIGVDEWNIRCNNLLDCYKNRNCEYKEKRLVRECV